MKYYPCIENINSVIFLLNKNKHYKLSVSLVPFIIMGNLRKGAYWPSVLGGSQTWRSQSNSEGEDGCGDDDVKSLILLELVSASVYFSCVSKQRQRSIENPSIRSRISPRNDDCLGKSNFFITSKTYNPLDARRKR